MNTPKYNIEHEIKKQIEEREIAPTRDLWSEIENQTSSPTSPKTRINWFLVAACLGLLLSLGIILINTRDEIPQPQITETTIQPEISQPEKNIKTEVPSLLAEKTETVPLKNKEVIPSRETKISKPEVIASKSEVPFINEKQKSSIIENAINTSSNNIAKIDSAKIPVKRKRFVDPSTLLFSVEHKDVIEKSKDGSNVATIDLNSK